MNINIKNFKKEISDYNITKRILFKNNFFIHNKLI
jgi:hypothetical protein